MNIEIRETQPADIEMLKTFVVLAFEPIFESFAKILGETVFPIVYPDWHKLQRSHVVNFFENQNTQTSHTRVAVMDNIPVGFIAYKFTLEEQTGEIEFLFVHPEYQSYGVGTLLNEYALRQMREAGLKVAVVSTGGDESHAPARNAYEKVGFRPLPNIWYFKSLD